MNKFDEADEERLTRGLQAIGDEADDDETWVAALPEALDVDPRDELSTVALSVTPPRKRR